MRTLFAGSLFALAVTACAAHHVEPLDHLPFAFEARLSRGEVWVLPTLSIHGPIEIDERHMLGAALPLPQRTIRAQRTAELEGLGAAIAEALPGEVNGRLGSHWKGQFRHDRRHLGWEQRLGDAVSHRRPDLHWVLENYAQNFGRWVLLTWVTDISSDPLVRRAMPGEVVTTPAGPVVVDFDDDPHVVSVKLGTALLSPDGDVVLRYEDRFDTVLTGSAGKREAARHLARALADEITMVWMTENRLTSDP